MAVAKSPRKKSKDSFVTIYMGPVGGETSTAILEVPDTLPKKMAAVFRYLNEARFLRNQQKVVLDFFREAKAGIAGDELARLSQRVKEHWDNMDRVSVISESGSDEPEKSGHQCLFVRMWKIKKLVSEEVSDIKKRLIQNPSSSHGSPPAREQMDLMSFTVKYEKLVTKIEVTLGSYMDSLDGFQEEIKAYPQAEKDSNFYVDFREKRGDPVHHKMTIHEGLVQRVESISAAALLILKYTAKIEAKLKEKNIALYEALQERKRAVPSFRTLQPQAGR